MTDRSARASRSAAPHVSPAAWRRVRAGARLPAVAGSLVIALLIALPWLLGAPPGAAQSPAAIAWRAGSLSFDGEVTGAAISADESLLATAVADERDGTTVVLTDRRSRAVLGTIRAEAGAGARVAFSPVGHLLLVAGEEALELWEVPIAPLSPDRPLPGRHMRWRVEVDEERPIGSFAFGPGAGEVAWSEGNRLYRRPVAAGSPAPAEPAYRGDGASGVALRFAARPGAPGMLVHTPGRKGLDVLDDATLAPSRKLEGHRFPVVGAALTGPGGPASLDEGFYFIEWGADGAAALTRYFQPPRNGMRAAAMRHIAGTYYLISAEGEGGPSSLIVDAAQGRVQAVLPAGGALAVSPTGRYLLHGSGGQVRIYQFARPMPGAEYVRRLRALGGEATARDFVQMVDEAGLPKGTKAALRRALEVTPDSVSLKDYLSSLAAAEHDNDLEGMAYWANKILTVEPEHPRARAALGRITTLREARVMEEARAALEEGRLRQVIATLSTQIPAHSPRYGEARQLIADAEAGRALETALEQAREKLNLNRLPAAEALVNEVLRQDADNPQALRLLDEIEGRQGALNFEPLTFLFVALLLVALVAAALLAMRRLMRGMFVPPPRDRTEEAPHRPPGGRAGARAARREAPRAGPAPERPPDTSGPERTTQAAQEHAEYLFQKAEEMIRLSRQADIHQQHTALLLELEAELHAIQRRITDQMLDARAAHGRLEEIIAHLRRLKLPRHPPQNDGGREATYYELLRLGPNASQREIKAAYHELLKEYHPDLHTQSTFGWVRKEAEQMSKRLSEAYEVLSDVSRREQYNRQLQKKRG